MSNSNDVASPAQAPPARKLLLASVAAFAGAAVILVTTVLPVEYGLDPLGAGKALGLMREPLKDQAMVVAAGSDGLAMPVKLGAATLFPVAYKTDSLEIVLEPYDYVEYKYHLAEGADLVFNWSATATLIHDFHGDPDANPRDVRTYDKSNKSGASGSLTAPVTGIHGWFWENPGGERITIRLASAGFYSHAVEIRSDRTQQRHELTSVQLLPSSAPQ